MKKQLPLIVFFSIMSIMLNAQTPVNDGWVETGNATDNSEMYSIAFPTASIGFAVGSGGACLKTTDGGATWIAIGLNVPYDLKKITFPSANIGFIAGGFGSDYGKVLKTTNGGSTWLEVFNFQGSMNSMFFLDASHGWIASYDRIFSTNDGGSTWSPHDLVNFYDILSIVFVTPTKGYLTPNNASIGVQMTTDGGSTWHSTLSMFATDLDYTDENTVYALKSNSPGLVYKTTDSGTNWTNKSTGLSGSLKGINFVSATTGFVWSRDPHFGKIFRTSNAGEQWSAVYDNPAMDINSVTSTPGGQIVAVGAGGMIMKSTNGTEWETVHMGTISGGLRRVAFMNNLSGFAVGDKGCILKTTDGGINWVPLNLGIQQNLTGLSFVNEQVGFLAGDGSTLYKTINGGTTWTSSNNGLDASEVRQIIAWDSQRVYVGSNNGIYVTKNGGNTWSPTSYTSIAYTIFLIDADTILASDIVKFRYSYDGALTWNEKSVPRTFFSMYFAKTGKGVIGDSWGRIHKTNNNGQDWEQKFNCNSAVYDMTFINDTVGYFVADNGYIGKTTDGGESWLQVESGTIRNLKSIFFTPDGTGFIVGKDGLILRKAAVSTYSLDFYISDDSGNQVNDVVISVNGFVYPAGITSISGLIAGTYNYVISKSGFKPYTGSVDLSSDTIEDIILSADLDAPTVLAPTSVSALGFTANWEGVTAAESYLLYVSADNFATHLPGYDGLAVTGTNLDVTISNPAVDYYYRLKSKNSFGRSSYSNTVFVSMGTGIENLAEAPFTFYPNPATNLIVISTEGFVPEEIDILNIYGSLILRRSDFRQTGTKSVLDVSTLKSGVYYIRLLISNKFVVKKMIVL
jgi:photosystem II stability/assembly factor-like uncharacterized protein